MIALTLVVLSTCIHIYINHMIQSGDNFYEGIEDGGKMSEKIKGYSYKSSCF